MTRLTRTSLFLTVLFGLFVDIRGSEADHCPPPDVSHLVATEPVEPQRVVVRRLAIPDSAPTFEDDAVVPTPPPPFAEIPFASFDSATVRGQSPGFRSTFDERPPPPEGTIDDPSVIPDKLTGEPKSAETEETTVTPGGAPKTAQLTNGVLLLVTVCALALLFYAIVIAWDYRQRWMQALTTQNSRLASAFDDGTLGFAYSDDADLYGSRRFDPVEI